MRKQQQSMTDRLANLLRVMIEHASYADATGTAERDALGRREAAAKLFWQDDNARAEAVALLIGVKNVLNQSGIHA